MKQWVTLLWVPYAWRLSFSWRHHFIDGANLRFHEAGDVVLNSFCDWLQFRGDMLGQLAFPAATFWHFLREEKFSDAGIGLFWIGKELMNIGHCIADARPQTLSLVGGGIHDWGWRFGRHDWFNPAEQLGGYAYFVTALLAVVCKVYLLRRFFWQEPER